ncbi:Glycosyl hydrolase family 2, sugar binding domain protein [Candidatus Sulfopaludibacter sp. SbA6]|nr:Glycosyl hydrolase family 2, sugar binding domain protein [Candidatus Sulfopaludibacter sp. SbA6]
MRLHSLLLLAVVPALTLGAADSNRIDLSGSWAFQLDAAGAGRTERWQERKLGPDVIFLPGSTDQAGYGTKVVEPENGWLTRPYKYEGAAWYQKEVAIPAGWQAKHITLFLERPHWQTEVWVDGKPFGAGNSLSTPHEYDLSGALTPGRHRITICVDNSYKIDVGRSAHSVTEHTQTNWNGIVGAIELRATDPVWIESVAVYPGAQQQARFVCVIRNRTGAPVDGEITAAAGGAPTVARFTRAAAESTVELTVSIPEARAWDEYQPALYSLSLALAAERYRDRRELEIGLRRIATRGTQFTLNGRPIFLRGTLECNIFPLTGYPSTRVDDWQRIFRIARSYGLNAFRFHSYCPPEAAFVAADREGFLLHVELPVWSRAVGKDAALDDFMRAEGSRILKTYGNHPSFTMLCLGNELQGDFQFMDALLNEFKKSDARRLYTFSSDHVRRAPGPTSDYYVTQQTSVGRLRINGARFTTAEDGTDLDFSPSVAAVHVPLVSHELGQWAVYPSFDEIAKYTGVLKARNLEPFRESLAAAGMIDQARDFQVATGRFSWAVYKEDMEAALRTPNYGGFFLLQLEDFPGQGEALVGLLDSFWDSKGILTPEEFRRFCGPTVPLLRMKKFVWTAGESFTARAEVAHYGHVALSNAAATWSAIDDAGRAAASGKFAPVTLTPGSVTALGDIHLPLDSVTRAAHWKISIHLAGTEFRNDWDVWVYPKPSVEPPPAGILIKTSLDAEARSALDQGRKVVLLAPPEQKGEMLLPMRFLPVFWSNGYFTNQPGTMGILCDPKHPALAEFPTFAHESWQYWELTEGSHAFILDKAPLGFRPIIQVIDDFHRNHRLGAVIEATVGKGKLLAVSFDLTTALDRRPVARQLLHSLLDYAASERFAPKQALSLSDIAY